MTAAGARAGLLAGLVVTATGAAGAPSARAQAPASPVSPASGADADAARRDETQAAAAQQAAQELEVRLIEIRRELDALGRQRASWEDIRRRLDEVDARVQSLAHEQEATGDGAGADGGIRFRDNGIVLRSPDDSFALRPMLRLQGRYQGELASAGLLNPARPDTSTFLLAHAEIILEGHAGGPRLEYRLQVDFAERPMVKDAFVQWRLDHSVAVRLGQFKVPYSLQRQYWTGHLEFADLARPMTAFTLERDVGLMLVGRPHAGRLQYQLAVVNGAGAGRINDNVDLAYAARVVAAPLGPLPTTEGDIEGHSRPLFSIGASGYYNLLPTDVRARDGSTAPLDLDGDGRVDNVAVWQGAVELRAVFAGAALQAEWFGRREQPGGGAPNRAFWGAYAQASYFILPRRLQLAARAGRTDLPLYGVAAEQRLNQGSRVDEQSAAVSAYLRGHDAKLQVDYSHLSAAEALSAPVVHRVRAAVQLAF